VIEDRRDCPPAVDPTQRRSSRIAEAARTGRALKRRRRPEDADNRLPDDDVEVVYLLKRGLAHLAPAQVTVVDDAIHVTPPALVNNLQEHSRWPR